MGMKQKKIQKILLNITLVSSPKQQLPKHMQHSVSGTFFLEFESKNYLRLNHLFKEGKYIQHKSPSDKKAPTITDKVLEVIDEFDSRETLDIVKTDGENTNTGWKGTFLNNFD